MFDVCKQARKELDSFFYWICWSFTSSAAVKEKKKKKKNNFPADSILQQNQPEQTGNTPSPILPSSPPSSLLLSSLVLTPHCTLRFLQSSCSRDAHTGTKTQLCESHCRPLVTIFTPLLIDSPLLSRLPPSLPVLLSSPLFLPFPLLRLILKAQHSLYWEEKW